jgi:hypothetical protein
MGPVELNKPITFLAGRPHSGMTPKAIETCRRYLHAGWNIIYYHAEGMIDADVAGYGVELTEHLQQIQLVTDLNFSIEELHNRLQRFFEARNPKGYLVVIDTLELFDCAPEDLFSFVQAYERKRALFLILIQLPKYLERRTRDHSKDYVRKTYPTEMDHQVIVSGDFPIE